MSQNKTPSKISGHDVFPEPVKKRTLRELKAVGPISSIDPVKLKEALREVAEANTVSISFSSDGDWYVRSGRSKRASKHFPTKNLAIKYGRKLCKETNTDLIIYSKDGRILESKRHGVVRKHKSN